MASSRDHHHPSYKFVPLAPAPGPSQQQPHHPVATAVVEAAAYNGMDSDDSGGGAYSNPPNNRRALLFNYPKLHRIATFCIESELINSSDLQRNFY